MKIAPLLIASASALETSSTAKNLLSAVGHRNVSHMEALIQGLADESVQVPGWKFDADIQAALEAIRAAFVGNIQTALKDAHKSDQENLNCQTAECFGNCISSYNKGNAACNDLDAECTEHLEGHKKCRYEVHASYVEMAKSCANLHCFIKNWKDEECESEKCICPDLAFCHKSGGGYDEQCVAQIHECKGELGGWLQVMIQKFKSGHATWSEYWSTCRKNYHSFLRVDMECDATQKKFESCKCKQRLCDHRACSVEFEQCQQRCWDIFEPKVPEIACLEKDRKIDWSATKKIECYVDILLHDYTKDELLTRCGSTDCVNTVREEDYKHCHSICLEVDHDGVWPEVHSNSLSCQGDATPYAGGVQSDSQTAWISAHHYRKEHDEYHLGDSLFACDANGEEVYTVHRGGDKDRAGEERCTEHLDIDYPVPPCCDCEPERPKVCDEKFHVDYYCEFDDTTAIGCITDCCDDCFGPVSLKSVERDYSGECTLKFTTLSVAEHTNAWAFNRCPCTDCVPFGDESTAYGGPPGYDSPPPDFQPFCHELRSAKWIMERRGGGGGAGGAYGL